MKGPQAHQSSAEGYQLEYNQEDNAYWAKNKYFGISHVQWWGGISEGLTITLRCA